MLRRRLTVGIVLAVFALDFLTKALVSRFMFVGESRWLVHGWAALTYVRNTGVAFGLFPGKRASFIVLSLIGIGAVVAYLLRHPPRLKREAWALGLFLGGACGNLVDRVRWGEVVDFIELGPPRHTFAVFNVADMGVTCGVVLLLVTAVTTRHPAAPLELADDPALLPDALAGDAVADAPVDAGEDAPAEHAAIPRAASADPTFRSVEPADPGA